MKIKLALVLLVNAAANAQSSAASVVSWQPGAEQIDQQGRRWQQLSANGQASASVRVYDSGEYTLAQFAVKNLAPRTITFLPAEIGLSITAPSSQSTRGCARRPSAQAGRVSTHDGRIRTGSTRGDVLQARAVVRASDYLRRTIGGSLRRHNITVSCQDRFAR